MSDDDETGGSHAPHEDDGALRAFGDDDARVLSPSRGGDEPGLPTGEGDLSIGERSLAAALTAGEPWTPARHRRWCADQTPAADPDAPITVRAAMIRAILFVEGAHMAGCEPPLAEAERLTLFGLDPKRRHLAQALVIDWVTDNLAQVKRAEVEKEMEAKDEFEPLPEFWTDKQKADERKRRVLAERRWRAHHLVANRPVVMGELDFTGGRFPGALMLRGCVFDMSEGRAPGTEEDSASDRSITLDRASLGGLDLTGAALGSLSGDRLRIQGDLKAWALDAHDARLQGVRIGGALHLQGARLRATSRNALDASAAEIGADVFLRDGFYAGAEVNFMRARIGGQLYCAGGRFEAKADCSLNANAAEIGADVFLMDGFRASREVNFGGAKIGGQLACAGGRFEATVGRALDGEASEIGGDVFLRDGFRASAKVDFMRASIAGSLYLNEGRFEPALGGVALDLISAHIGESLIFAAPWSANDTARISGDVDLSNARCAVLDDRAIRTDGGEPWLAKDAKLRLDGFTYGRLGSASPKGWPNRKVWLDRQPAEDRAGESFKPQPYEQLASVLRDMGHAAEAREVGMAKERAHHGAVWRRKPEGNRVQRVFARVWWAIRWVLFKLTGYGYRPARAFMWVGLPLLVFSLFIFASAYRLGFVTPAQPHAAIAELGADVAAMSGEGRGGGPPCLAADLSEAVPPFHAGMYVIDAFVPLVDVDQESSWKPARSPRCDGDAQTLARLDTFNPGWAFNAGEQGWWFSPLTNTIDTVVRWWAPRGGLLWLQWTLMIAGFAISALIAASLSGLIRRD